MMTYEEAIDDLKELAASYDNLDGKSTPAGIRAWKVLTERIRAYMNSPRYEKLVNDYKYEEDYLFMQCFDRLLRSFLDAIEAEPIRLAVHSPKEYGHWCKKLRAYIWPFRDTIIAEMWSVFIDTLKRDFQRGVNDDDDIQNYYEAEERERRISEAFKTLKEYNVPFTTTYYEEAE